MVRHSLVQIGTSVWQLSCLRLDERIRGNFGHEYGAALAGALFGAIGNCPTRLEVCHI